MKAKSSQSIIDFHKLVIYHKDLRTVHKYKTLKRFWDCWTAAQFLERTGIESEALMGEARLINWGSFDQKLGVKKSADNYREKAEKLFSSLLGDWISKTVQGTEVEVTEEVRSAVYNAYNSKGELKDGGYRKLDPKLLEHLVLKELDPEYEEVPEILNAIDWMKRASAPENEDNQFGFRNMGRGPGGGYMLKDGTGAKGKKGGKGK